MYDYEEHFRFGIESGKTEEEIVIALGDPSLIAKQYRANQTIELANTNPSTKNIFGAVLAAVSLGFFNLVIVLGPFIALVGVVFALFASAIAVIISGLALTIASIASPIFPGIISVPLNVPLTAITLFGVGTSALGLLFFIGVYNVAKYFSIVTIKYLKWNLSIINK
jgi:uncharacterized membrane protein